MPAEREPPRALVLGSDYGAPTPIWLRSGGNLDLASLGLGKHLVKSLLAWQRHFDEHFHYDREPAWDSAESADWYAREGTRLHDELSNALPTRNVSLDLWPVNGTAPSF